MRPRPKGILQKPAREEVKNPTGFSRGSMSNDVDLDTTSDNGIMYRMRVGQVPGDNNLTY